MLSRALSLFNVVHYTVTSWKGMLEFEIRSHNRQHIPGGAYGGVKKFWRAEAQLNTWEGVGMGTDILNVCLRGATSMIAYPIKTHDMF